MVSLPPITLRLRGWKLIDRVALAFLLLCSVALGAAAGLLFVYESDLPEIRALETYRPNVVTEIYADDGQLVGSFALQRRILMTWEQVPKVLYNAVTAIEDQHHHHATGRQPLPGPQRPQLPPQSPGNAPRAPDRAALHQTANLHHVRQPGLPGSWQLRLRRRRAILFRQKRDGPESPAVRAACRNDPRPHLLAACRSRPSACAAQSGAATDDGRRQNHPGGGRSRKEDSARPPRAIPPERSGTLFLRRYPQISGNDVRYRGGARAGAAHLHYAQPRHAKSRQPGDSRRLASIRPPARLARQASQHPDGQSREAGHLRRRRLAPSHRKGKLHHGPGPCGRREKRDDQDRQLSRDSLAFGHGLDRPQKTQRNPCRRRPCPILDSRSARNHRACPTRAAARPPGRDDRD